MGTPFAIDPADVPEEAVRAVKRTLLRHSPVDPMDDELARLLVAMVITVLAPEAAASVPIGLACALAHRFPEVSLFDPASVPAHVRDKLAVIGYWVCSRDLRDRVDGWDHLNKSDEAVTENDLELLGSVLARP